MFYNDRPIFQQMAERLEDELLCGTYATGDRIPSVREYAVMLGVNVNTAAKAYEQLARTDIVYNRRGLGYYVADNAREKILSERRQRFMGQDLPEMFRQMRLLGITIGDINDAWEQDNTTITTQPTEQQ